MHNKQRGFIVFSFIIILLVVVLIGVFVFGRLKSKNDFPEITDAPQTQEMQKSTTPFTFTAAGDFSSSDNASEVLKAISTANSDFTLALGDLGYGGNGTEQAWCDFVTSRIGTEHPFQIIAGNHDDGTKDGNITEYAKCLPDKIGNLTGEYGVEYYFDYGNLARFIMISPDIRNYGFDYAEGSEHLQRVIDSVNDARSKNIDWIVLGMHKNCITPGVKECEIGDDLLNTAVNLKIDLVLQGHEHAYFRSKQLALDKDTCPAIIVNEFNEKCVSKSGDKLKKGAGTIIVISGAGGYDLRDVNLQDKEFNYFQAVNGKNSGNTFGFSKFDVSKDELKSSFVPAVGSFTDSFSIGR